jgi:hypothetical protein
MLNEFLGVSEADSLDLPEQDYKLIMIRFLLILFYSWIV